MDKVWIPVDVYNAGQVFASLGFLELADVLCGPARGGFVWDDSTETRFLLEAPAEGNPFEHVLQFLVSASIYEVVPAGPEYGLADVEPRDEIRDDNDVSDGAPNTHVVSQTFPTGNPQKSAHPIRFQLENMSFDVTHWSDGSSRRRFKLYSGNRTAVQIAKNMVHGIRDYRGLKTLWDERPQEMLSDPFNLTTSMGGSFNFDPRGAWTALDAGYSPNDQKHGVEASPLIEMLAPIGLEHARPNEQTDGRVTYAIWRGLARPMLARPALAGAAVGLGLRKFQFTLGESGRNRIVTFAQEVAVL